MTSTTGFLEKPLLNPGDQIGSITLFEQIGKGGQATVWSGWDYLRDRLVAVKAYPRNEQVKDQQADFEREAHIVASLEHAHTLPLYDFGTTSTVHYFVTPYVLGSTLKHLVADGPVQPKFMLKIMAQVASALDYVHAQGVVHRDVKPGNVMIDFNAHTYLADFGLAKSLPEITLVLHTGRGTPPYAPPEQHTRAALTALSDVYSYGVMAYELLTGSLPWAGDTSLAIRQLHESEELPDPRDENPDLPAGLAQALRRITAPEPKDRPQSAGEAYRLIAAAFGVAPENLPGAAVRLDQEEEGTGNLHSPRDARKLMEMFLSGWQADSMPFSFDLTRFVLLDAFYAFPEKFDLDMDNTIRAFMLRGAIVHDFHLSLWWLQTDSTTRVRVCEHVLLNDGEIVVGRMLTRLISDPEMLNIAGLSARSLRQLITLAETAASAVVRRDALQVVEQAMQPTSRWQPSFFTAELEDALVSLMLSGGAISQQAARIVGKLQSEYVVQKLLETGDRRQIESMLLDIQKAAGSLPEFLPALLRFRLSAKMMRQRVFGNLVTLPYMRVAIGVISAAVVSAVMMLGFLRSSNLQTSDQLYGGYPVSDIVTVVKIDDASFTRFGRWDEWPRSLHAQLIDRLNSAGARVIAFDVVLASESAGDDELVNVIEQAGNIVQPFIGEGSAYNPTPDNAGIWRFDSGIGPGSNLRQASAGVGHANILHDPDGYVRRMPVVIDVADSQYASLPIESIRVYLGMDTSAPVTIKGNAAFVAGRDIPLGDRGAMWLNFAGTPASGSQSAFNMITYQDVIDGNFDTALINNRIILVGIMATAEPDQNLTPVSSGQPMYGVEILANAIESIWSERFITISSVWVQAVILLALGVITGLITSRPVLGFFFAIIEAALYFLAASLAFSYFGLIIGLFFPLAAIALSYVTVTTYHLAVEVRHRREIMQMFRARTTNDIARAALKAVERGDINLSGEMRDVSILCINVRGYQAYAQSNEPQAVMDLFNALRKLVSEVVFVHEGVLMTSESSRTQVLFNVPVDQPDHTLRAVRAALEVVGRFRESQEKRPVDHPFRALAFSCGISTGRAVVGYDSEGQSRSYGAVGSVVDIAVKIAENAPVGQVVVTDEVNEKVQDYVESNVLAPLSLDGHPLPVSIYAIHKRQVG